MCISELGRRCWDVISRIFSSEGLAFHALRRGRGREYVWEGGRSAPYYEYAVSSTRRRCTSKRQWSQLGWLEYIEPSSVCVWPFLMCTTAGYQIESWLGWRWVGLVFAGNCYRYYWYYCLLYRFLGLVIRVPSWYLSRIDIDVATIHRYSVL